MSAAGPPSQRREANSRPDARWRPAAVPFALWAVLLGIAAGVHAGFGGHVLPVLIQGGGAAVAGAIAIGILLADRLRSRPAGRRRAVPGLSLATALVAVSIAAMVCGAAVGGWLIIGGGLGLAAGVGGLVREHRAQRGAIRAAALQPAQEKLDGGSVR